MRPPSIMAPSPIFKYFHVSLFHSNTADGTTDTADENQGTTGGTTANESPNNMYQSFQSCLETAEGTETFATEDEIRDCFIEAGFTGASDDNQDEDENEDDEDENDN
jgi:hypothetical protein